jgi:signal transduction histidine kinase
MNRLIQFVSRFFNPERRTAVIYTAVVLVFLSAFWWQVRTWVEDQLVLNAKEIVQYNLNSYGANLHQGVLDKIALTESLTTFVTIEVEHHGTLNEARLEEFSAGVYQSASRIRNIALAPNGVMQFVYPYEENKSVLGYEPIVDERPEVREQVLLAIDSGEVTLSQPVELIQGGLGLITRQAVFVEEQYWGLANIVLDVPGLLDDAGITGRSNIDLVIKDNNGIVIFGSEGVDKRDPVYSTIPLPGGSWEIAGVPRNGWEQFYQGGARIINVMAHLINILVALMVYTGIYQQRILSTLVDERTVALRKTERELREDIAIRKKVEAEKDRLLASESYQRVLAETLSEITLALTSHVDIQSVLDELLEQTQSLIRYETANIVLVEDGYLHIRAHKGYQNFGVQDFYGDFTPKLENIPLDKLAVISKSPVLIGDVTKDPDWLTFEATSWIRSFLSVPITQKGEVIGMIRLDSQEVDRFTERDVERLKPIANAASIALENAALFEQAQTEIRERIKAENEIRELNEQLEERVSIRTQELEIANRELEAFSYSISHDLRAPLRAVSGISEIFREEYADVLDKQAFEYLERMDASSKKMSNLIEGLLTLTQLGRQEFSPANFDLQEVAAEVFEELTSNMPPREIDFKLVGNDQIVADQRLIASLLTNLLSNAIKFTRDSRPAEIVVGSQLRNGQLVFYVKDNGIGLNEEYADVLFEPFQRLYLEDEFEGMGIGLAIAKRIIQRHQGTIWVESESGEGACFFFTLSPGAK